MSELEEALALHMRAAGIPAPEREYRFDPTRRWRLDFCWPDLMLGVEVEGGIWSGGAHGRGSGIVGDIEKSNALALAGWKLLRVHRDMIEDGTALSLIEQALAGKKRARPPSRSRALRA